MKSKKSEIFWKLETLKKFQTKLIYLLLITILITTIFTGCVTETEDIKSEEEASEAMSELGEDIGGVGAALEDIDESLGGEG